MAPKKHEASDRASVQPNKRARVESPSFATVLNPLDCNLDFLIESDEISGSALHNEGFAYCWSGARATSGVKGGKYCFGCRVMENQPVIMDDTTKDLQNLCRVGLSNGNSDVGNLGESMSSFGYGGTGKFSHGGDFTSYGGVFGVGDMIMCAVDLENPSRAKVSFAKNGKWLGVALEFDAGPKGLDITGAEDYKNAIFPHVLLKNVKVRMMFSIDHGLQPLEGFKPWDAAMNDGNAVEGPQAADGCDCEVIMMVGLPGSGKTTWAQKWVREHPEKRYVLLGTNSALDQMKVPGLMRKRNYGERFERLMKRATKIFNQLMDRASKTPRNFIVDQTNVYRNARIRKLKPFRHFYKIAVVVFPHPEELKRRTCARAEEMGKEVPEDAFNEMLANFVLPNSKEMLSMVEPFDEVRFTELQRRDAERHLVEMKSALKIKNDENLCSSSFLWSAHDRSATEDKASRQGSYSSGYMLQDLEKSPHLPFPSLRSQVPYRSATQAPTPQTHESTQYQSPYGPPSIYFQGCIDLHSRQSTFINRYPVEGSYGGHRESFPAADPYGRETCVNSFYGDGNGSSKGSLISSHHIFHSSPWQGTYGPRSRVVGCDIPDQTLPSTSPVGGYPGDFSRSGNSFYGDLHLPSSRAGERMPSLPMPMLPSYPRRH